MNIPLKLFDKFWNSTLRNFSMIGIGLLVFGIVYINIAVSLGTLTKDEANLIQAVASVIANPILNRFLTWNKRNISSVKMLLRYFLAKTVTISINQLIFALIPSYNAGYMISNMFIMAMNYPINEVFVFGEGSFSHDLAALFRFFFSYKPEPPDDKEQ